MCSSRQKWGKPKCPLCADWPVSWLGGKRFWRMGKSHLSAEILDPAPPQLYSLEGISNNFSKKRYIFQTFPLKLDHNALKGGESVCKVTMNTTPAHQKILKRYKGNLGWWTDTRETLAGLLPLILLEGWGQWTVVRALLEGNIIWH